ncbi:PREDICTED: transducin-like enhancer protein 6 [Condylura cristata]|uniref:transducin-like enhancer protein 6 n=1 Tax=Condylura cristata TaxID=143302 RepID=UPI0006437733|nr:PREDICTED: transducin-like enhancer protein 6 [Condylura cristata]
MAEPPGALPSLPALNSQGFLEQLRKQFPRLPEHLRAQLENMDRSYDPVVPLQLQKILQDLQEYHKQGSGASRRRGEAQSKCTSSSPQNLEKATPGKPFTPGEQPEQDSWGPASPKAPWHPRVRPLRPSSLQGPALSDVVATRPSDWLQQLSRAEEAAASQLDTKPPWDAEPQFWEDVLTEQLWQILVGLRDEADGPGHGTTEQAPGLESQGPGPHHQRAEPAAEDTPDTTVLSRPVPSPGSPEGPRNAESTGSGGTPGGRLFHAAQESARRPCQFLKPICWDPEDFEDTWERPDALPWQAKKLAVPHRMEKMRVLTHGETLLVTTISSFTRHAFTCGRSGVKVWSLVGQVMEDRFPESHLTIQTPGAHLRTCLLTPSSMTLLMGGNSLAGVTVWDLRAPSLHMRDQLPCVESTCQALAANLKDSLALAGFSDGTVRIWDLRDQSVVRDLPGAQDGARNLVVREQQVWTGGLDACLRCWDLRSPREPQEYQFDSQIMSLSPHPREDLLLVGTATGQQWLQPTHGGQKYTVGCKDSTILGLRFSPLGQWWVSVGTDNLVSVYSMPTGTKVFQVPETSCIVCCDVSPNNRLIITGSQKQATVYQITY